MKRSRLKPGSWAGRRRAALERDGQRCRKCLSPTGLEAHHIKERVYGGTDALDNLITLCSLCHDEWTYAEPPATVMSFAKWLTIPPARYLVAFFALDWPNDRSAADFKAAILTTIALSRAA